MRYVNFDSSGSLQSLPRIAPRHCAMAVFTLIVSIAAAEPALHAENDVLPGGVAQVAITESLMEDVVVTLKDNQDRTLSRAEGFVWRTPTGRAISVALLGIPSTAAPGKYRIVMRARHERTDWQLERPINLIDVTFPEQLIHLSDKMNEIFHDDSERKKMEARELWAVLNSFNPRTLYHLGRLVSPLEEWVPTAAYGDRRRFRMPNGSESTTVHFGRDLWAPVNSPISAAGKGRVIMAKERYLTGNTVVIEHLPGVFTLYYHMDTLGVEAGQIVNAGEFIGTIGETGFATGVHLHWELRVGTVPVEPDAFLEKPLLDTNMLIGKM